MQGVKKRFHLIVIFILTLLVLACGSGASVVQPTAPAAAVRATEANLPTAAPVPTQPPAPPAPPVGYVSRAMLGDAWPLTVEEGVLACAANAVTFSSGGTIYALNGTAKQRSAGADIAPIWADNPAVKGLKQDIGPLITRGLALC